VSYHALTEWYSPVIYQDVGCTVYGDYITRIDYDGDYVGNNNWNNLGYPNKARPLPAYVYTAVMETSTHYFIWYALFHPADDFHCHTYRHENDFEGLVLCVHKDGSPYGDLRMVQMQAHTHFYQYTPPGESGIYEGEDSIDGTIQLDTTYPGVHPVVYVEGGGHGLRNEDTGDWPSVVYYYTGHAEDPDDVGHAHCGYDLLSIYSEVWARRDNCCGDGHLFDNMEHYSRWGFSVSWVPTTFDGDDFSIAPQEPDMGWPPWNWDDSDDGDEWLNGDWFMHPAGYHAYRLQWDEDFATNYTFQPFGLYQLGGDIYNGTAGTTTLRDDIYGPYTVVSDLTILPDQLLALDAGVTLNFESNTQIISDGRFEGDGREDTIRVVSLQHPDRGLALEGELLVKDGGSIRLP
jgi:hypothetical protein